MREDQEPDTVREEEEEGSAAVPTLAPARSYRVGSRVGRRDHCG